MSVPEKLFDLRAKSNDLIERFFTMGASIHTEIKVLLEKSQTHTHELEHKVTGLEFLNLHLKQWAQHGLLMTMFLLVRLFSQ